MGCDYYFMEKKLDEFKFLYQEYMHMQPLFRSMTSSHEWIYEKEPEDGRVFFGKKSGTLSFGREFNLPSTGPGEDAGAIQMDVIMLFVIRSSSYYCFTSKGEFKISHHIAPWQYVN